MLLIFLVISLCLTLRFPSINTALFSHIEQPTFEARVKRAETILFGRFNWAVPINTNDRLHQVHSSKQNTFEFLVYCTIKQRKTPDNVPRTIRILIDHQGKTTDTSMLRRERFFFFRNGNRYEEKFVVYFIS